MLKKTLYSVTLPAVYIVVLLPWKRYFQSDFEGFQINGVNEANGHESSTFTAKNSTFKQTTQTKTNKKQSVHKHFVWDPCSHHGGVKLKKRGFIYIISQDQGPSKRTQHWKPVLKQFLFLFLKNALVWVCWSDMSLQIRIQALIYNPTVTNSKLWTRAKRQV